MSPLTWLTLLCVASATYAQSMDDLVMVHLIHRHGARTPIPFNYPTDPYKNVTFPRGGGQLTLQGKKDALRIGRNLRFRYRKFLKNKKFYDILYAMSSEFNRTKETLQALLTGIFPPSVEDRLSPMLNWQPIAVDYIRKKEDNMLAIEGSCPDWYIPTDVSGSFDDETKETFSKISARTGYQFNSFIDMYNIQDYLLVMEELGYKVPSFLEEFWPEPLNLYSNLGWHEMMNGWLKTITGNLLNKIATDSVRPLSKGDKRLYVYSGHDTSIVGFTSILDAFTTQHINYISHIAFEVYEVNGERIIKVYHDNNDKDTPTYLSVPACDSSGCTLDQFTAWAKTWLPTKEEYCKKES